MAHLAIALMGPCKVTLDGQPVAWFQSDKTRALLAYLAVEAAVPHARHLLAGLLWPDVPEAHAHHSLSQALCNLRTVLHDHATSPPYLIVTPHTIQFNGDGDCWVDVAEFGRLVNGERGNLAEWEAAAADTSVRHSGGAAGVRAQPIPRRGASLHRSANLPVLHQAVALYRGPFLDDLALGDAIGFEEWAALHRERLHRLLMAALSWLTDAHQAQGEWERALDCAWRQVEMDPWREEAHVQVMRLLARTGQRSEALVQYGICRRLLASELGVEPAAETQQLYEQIKQSRG